MVRRYVHLSSTQLAKTAAIIDEVMAPKLKLVANDR